MGTSRGKETCGRCSFTTVVDAVNGDQEGEDDERPRHDPFEGGYIEVDERELRLVSAPAVYAGRVKNWLDRTADRLIYGR